MNRIFIFLLVISNFAFAERSVQTGFANTNASRNLRYSVFVNDEGETVSVYFRSTLAAEQWKSLTSHGKTHVTLIGEEKRDGFKIYAVEPFVGEKPTRENSIGILRFDALRSWENVETAIEKSLWYKNSHVNTKFGVAPNPQYLHSLSAFIYSLIDSNRDEGFLQALIGIGDLAAQGIAEEKIRSYLDAGKQVLDIGQPAEVAKFAAKLKNECAKILNAEEKAVAYQKVVEDLKAALF